jgi:hypothetical protein
MSSIVILKPHAKVSELRIFSRGLVPPYRTTTGPPSEFTYSLPPAPYPMPYAPCPYTLSALPHTFSLYPFTFCLFPFTFHLYPFTFSLYPFTFSLSPLAFILSPCTFRRLPCAVRLLLHQHRFFAGIFQFCNCTAGLSFIIEFPDPHPIPDAFARDLADRPVG